MLSSGHLRWKGVEGQWQAQGRSVAGPSKVSGRSKAGQWQVQGRSVAGPRKVGGRPWKVRKVVEGSAGARRRAPLRSCSRRAQAAAGHARPALKRSTQRAIISFQTGACMQGCGRLWKAVEGCGGLWRAVEGCGGLWKRLTVGSGAVASAGAEACTVRESHRTRSPARAQMRWASPRPRRRASSASKRT